MKKIYCKPAATVHEISLCSIIANSTTVGVYKNTMLDASNSLSPRWRLTQQHLGLWLVGKACCVRGMRHGWQGFVTEMDNFYLYFNKSIEILYIFAKSLPLLKAPRGKRRGWHIIHKRRYWTLWFWRIWTSQLQLSVKNKATRTSHGMFYIQPSLGICLSLAIFLWRCFIYSSAWGFQRCSFRQIGAMRRPRYVERASDWLHVFFVYIW